jgi:hypothetical protein
LMAIAQPIEKPPTKTEPASPFSSFISSLNNLSTFSQGMSI